MKTVLRKTLTTEAMSEYSIIITAFVTGLFSAPHCTAMCGGIVGALSVADATSDKKRKWMSGASYNGGRIVTYMVMGVVFGAIGYSAVEVMPEVSVLLRTMAGLLMIAMGLYVAGWWMGLRSIERVGASSWQALQKLVHVDLGVPGHARQFSSGLVWGCLPCGLVYSMMTMALSTGSAVQGGLLMLSFGIGTAPLLLVTGVFAGKVWRFTNATKVRSTMGCIIVVFGFWIIVSTYWLSYGHHH
jgi:sulfite exporter TauE/SafE